MTASQYSRAAKATAGSRRRLYRPGDPYDVGREGGKTRPKRDDVSWEYHELHELIDWYERTWSGAPTSDPLLDLAERHRALWKGANADRYVRELREGWK